jgi:hypothetical protein
MELTAEQLQELRITVAESLGFVWMVQRPPGAGFAGRFLYRPEWKDDENYTWSDAWEVWDGKEDLLVYSDAFRHVPNYPTDPAQIGPMLEHFRAKWVATELLSDYRYWDIATVRDGYRVDIRDWDSIRVGHAIAPTLELAICLAIREYVQQDALPPSPATTQNGEG